jgi:GntR family transcriptional regulator
VAPSGQPWDAADPLGDARRRRADRARQVADVLRRQVLSGTFTGGTLPAESQLAGDFGVSRNAVRAALHLLRAEGLVERVPGVGTVVAEPKYPHGLDHLLGLAEVMRGHGDVTNEVRTTGIVRPPGPIAARLAVPAGTGSAACRSRSTLPISPRTSARRCSKRTWSTTTSSG